MKTENTLPTEYQMPKEVRWIAILLGFTFVKIFTGLLIPNLKMFGGNQPNMWLVPAISDTVLGLMVPLMIYVALKKQGVRNWALLLIYNAMGVFDLSVGLITEWLNPIVPQGLIGSPALTYGVLSFVMLTQLAVLSLLFNSKVLKHFTRA